MRYSATPPEPIFRIQELLAVHTKLTPRVFCAFDTTGRSYAVSFAGKVGSAQNAMEKDLVVKKLNSGVGAI